MTLASEDSDCDDEHDDHVRPEYSEDPDDLEHFDDPDDPYDPDDQDDPDDSYLVKNVICGKVLYFHKSYQVIKAKEVEIVKEVKRSDGL